MPTIDQKIAYTRNTVIAILIAGLWLVALLIATGCSSPLGPSAVRPGATALPAPLDPTPGLPQPIPVTVRLLDSTGRPLAGWHVAVEPIWMRTGADGRARIVLPLQTPTFVRFLSPLGPVYGTPLTVDAAGTEIVQIIQEEAQ